MSVGNGILQTPIPAGWPQSGLRASLGEIYWPAEWQLSAGKAAMLPNIWKPAFPLAYALAIVVLERAAYARGRSWPASLTLAGLIGFLGVLAIRLRHEYEPDTWRDAALLPVLRFTISENGAIAFETFDTVPGS